MASDDKFVYQRYRCENCEHRAELALLAPWDVYGRWHAAVQDHQQHSEACDKFDPRFEPVTEMPGGAYAVQRYSG